MVSRTVTDIERHQYVSKLVLVLIQGNDGQFVCNKDQNILQLVLVLIQVRDGQFVCKYRSKHPTTCTSANTGNCIEVT